MTAFPSRRRRDSPRSMPRKTDDDSFGYFSMRELKTFDLAFKEAMIRALTLGLEETWPGVYRNKPKEPPA